MFFYVFLCFFCGEVNVEVGCDCVVNGAETMRNVATNGGKETLERKEREIVFQKSFDCLLNDRKCAVYCHLRMKLAWCMLDKSWRGIGRGTNKTTSAQILGTTEGGFCLSRK